MALKLQHWFFKHSKNKSTDSNNFQIKLSESMIYSPELKKSYANLNFNNENNLFDSIMININIDIEITDIITEENEPDTKFAIINSNLRSHDKYLASTGRTIQEKLNFYTIRKKNFASPNRRLHARSNKENTSIKELVIKQANHVKDILDDCWNKILNKFTGKSRQKNISSIRSPQEEFHDTKSKLSRSNEKIDTKLARQLTELLGMKVHNNARSLSPSKKQISSHEELHNSTQGTMEDTSLSQEKKKPRRRRDERLKQKEKIDNNGMIEINGHMKTASFFLPRFSPETKGKKGI